MISAPTTLHPPASDVSLLQRYIDSNDPEIFAEIVHQYSRVVYSASWRILNDDAQAQEVSQEVFFRLMRQPGLVSNSLGGWLHRSATHLAIDVRRSDTARRRREKGYWTDRIAATEPESKWEEVSRYIDVAMDELPENERALLTRHFLEGISQADLATESNVSSATMSRRIKAAVVQLRKLLKKNGIYVGLVALMEFCRTESAKAAPPHFMTNLAQMNTVGPINLAAAPAAASPTYRPRFFQLRAAVADSSPHLIATGIGVIGLIIWLSIATVVWPIHNHLFHHSTSTPSIDKK